MINVSSEAAIKFAKAKAAQDKACVAFQMGETTGLHYDYLAARKAFIEASERLANELIAENFHEYTTQDDTP